MRESRFFQNCGTFCFNLYWKYHNFERNETRTTVFLKWTDFRKTPVSNSSFFQTQLWFIYSRVDQLESAFIQKLYRSSFERCQPTSCSLRQVNEKVIRCLSRLILMSWWGFFYRMRSFVARILMRNSRIAHCSVSSYLSIV